MRKVLIVDDNKLNRIILKKILESEYEVLTAEGGIQALDILHRRGDEISAVLLDIVMPQVDGYQVLSAIRDDPALTLLPVIITTGSDLYGSEVKALTLGANDYIVKPYNPDTIKHRLRNTIKLRETAAVVNAIRTDALTGLLSRAAFIERAEELVSERPAGYYMMTCYDVNGFKVINDQYGTAAGDEVLRYIANVFREGFEKKGGICSRITADNFAILYPKDKFAADELERIRHKAAAIRGADLQITYSIGRYVIDDKSLSAASMYDRASIAKNSIKGRFDVHIAMYDESMRERLLREQEIIGEMKAALEQRQFEVWYQPQYNHSTGAIIGAEALVRWRHPTRGLIPPGIFIPVFERNGFIYELDKFVWEEVCLCLYKWMGERRSPLPVSINISRYDLFRNDLIDVLKKFVTKYRIPVRLLRLEITESAFSESTEHIIGVVKKLIECGFTVEIDDFGSGYSSLNTLKDVPAQVLKLDMRFLENNENSSRGGNILESVVRMARWLGMSVIAEGVETLEQADYMKSIGCNYIQGYLYSKPVPREDYEALAKGMVKEERLLALETVETLDNSAFWDPKSMDTLIFNSYVGGACIFEYCNHDVEVIRANDKYARVLSDGNDAVTLADALSISWPKLLDEENRAVMSDAIAKAIMSGDETTCEFFCDKIPFNMNRTYLRTTLRVIASAGNRYLFYCTNINVTAQRIAEREVKIYAERLKAIMDNVGNGVTAAVIQDDNVHFIFANDRYYEILGYTRDQYIEEVTNTFYLIHRDDVSAVRDLIEQPFTHGMQKSIEYRVKRRDGKEVWVRAVMSKTNFQNIDTPVQITVLRDITDERSAQQKQRETDEQLLFLNESAHELLSTDDTQAGIDGVLSRTREYFCGSRAYVFEIDFESASASNTYEVCAAGVTSEKALLQNLDIKVMDYWINAFNQKNNINIIDVNSLDESRSEEKRLLTAQNITSLIAVPLFRDGALIGFIGIDNPKSHNSSIERLDAIGDYIAAMLTRRDMKARIESDNKNLRSLMDDTPGGFAHIR